ncbi:MAG TPA: rhodanese-like domain-containing protein [Luteolibacter sp.]
MKTLLLLGLCPLLASAQTAPNPQIDYAGFVTRATNLEKTREANRVSEDEFVRLMREPGTVVLDARTPDKFANIHIKGAINLPLTDFTAEALAKTIPDKTARILIYCNNNFANEPANFASKRIEVALNIQTFINLHAYGYTNVKELGPYLDVMTTKIPFEGKAVENGQIRFIGSLRRSIAGEQPAQLIKPQ